MIAASDLRIGNWVNFSHIYRKKQHHRPCEVYIVDRNFVILDDGSNNLSVYYDTDSINPIPLTPELLLSCGFEKLKGSNFVFRIFINDIEISVSTDLHFAYIDTLWGQASIKKPIFQYLHQVQNLVFALTGKELEIKNI